MTRMQVLNPGTSMEGGVGTVLSDMVRKDGFLRPMRSIGSMIGYKFIKNKLIKSRTQQFNNLVYGFAGCVATLLHDGVINPAEGAFAGAIAAAFTTPLDVCKTLLNTQQDVRPQGMLEAFRTVYRYGGLKGYFHGSDIPDYIVIGSPIVEEEKVEDENYK